MSTTQVKRLDERLAWYLNTPANFALAPVVLHADFSRDHILVSQGRVTGIIDFSDVSFGDPDCDFSSLFIDVGEDFTMEVARRYGHPDPQHLVEKLRYFDIADQIDTIVNGEGCALPGQLEQAWERLRRCLN
ncbi:MAG: aminoglycoside phosphotransferase family protein [Acidobacteriota bacterium]